MTIKLSYGVVDLSGLPDEIRYGPAVAAGEYRRVLDAAQAKGWGWIGGAGQGVPGVVALARLEVSW